MNRFYKAAVAASCDTAGFTVHLDGRPIRTPAKHAMAVPTEALAAAMAAEWVAQEAAIVPATMPLTQLANTAIDRVAPNRAAVIDALAEYGETDLVSHRVESPADLAERQAQAWQPLADWAAEAHGIALVVTDSLIAAEQPPESLAELRRLLEAQDDWRLTALQHVTGLTGSIILGLSLTLGRIDVVAADAAAHIDEDFQIERWGEDAEARARRNALRMELEAVERFLRLLEP